MKKLVALLLSMSMVALVAVGCGTPKDSGAKPGDTTTAAAGDAAKDKFVVDVFIYEFSDTYIGSVRNAIDAQLKAIPNVSYTFHDAASSQDTQNSQIDSAIAKGSNLLVVNIVETGSGDVVVKKAQDKSLPIIFFNREVSNEVVKSYEKASFVGTDPDQAGYMQGELVSNILLADNAYEKYDLNKDGKINYIMLRADLDNPEANGRTKYATQEANRLLKEAGKPELVQIGADTNCSWATDKAKTATDAFLTSNPFTGKEPIEVVFTNNDDMALGAIQSLNAVGYNTGTDETKSIIVVGVDATATAQDAILNGKMSGSVKQDAEAMATCVSKFIENTANGKANTDGTEYKYEDAANKVRISYSVFVK